MKDNFEIKFLTVLAELKFMPAEDVVQLLASYHESDADQIEDFLLAEGIIDQEQLLEALSEYYQVPSFDVVGYLFETHLIRMFPKELLLENEMVPLQVDENIMIMIAANPNNPDLLFEIGEHVSYDIRFYVGVARDICDAVKEFYDKADTEDEQDQDIRQEHLLMGEFSFIADEEGDVLYDVDDSKDEGDSFE